MTFTMPRLTLHIGPRRAANRSLDAFLKASSDALAAQGAVYLPEIDVARRFAEGEAAAVTVEAILSEAGAAEHVIVLAPCLLAGEAVAYLGELSAALPLTLTRFLRRQDDALESFLLSGASACTDVDKALSEPDVVAPWLDHAHEVAAMKDAVGAEALRLAVFDGRQQPVSDFCAMLGLHEGLDFGSAPHLNMRLPAQMAALLSRIDTSQLSEAKRCLLCDVLASASQKLDWPEILLAPEPRAALLAEFAEGNATLTKDFFGTSVLFDNMEPPSGAVLAQLELPQDSSVFLENTVAPLVLGLSHGGYLATR